MTTRRGTGYYKIPSLKGVWYRGPFEHNGSVATLEDWFDPARLRDDYVPTGFDRLRRENARSQGTSVRPESVGGRSRGADRVPQDAVSTRIALLSMHAIEGADRYVAGDSSAVAGRVSGWRATHGGVAVPARTSQARSRFSRTRARRPIPTASVKIYTIDLVERRACRRSAPRGDWNDEQPRWSPDGRRIAFKSNRGGSYNLYVMDADGRNVARLTDHGGNDHDPSWLPDGQSLVFSSDRDRGAGRSDLYRLWLADGRGRTAHRVLRGHTRSCRACRRTAAGSPSSRRRSRSISGGPTRCTCSSWRRGMTWPFERRGPGVLAELVARRPVDRARLGGSPSRRASRWSRRSARLRSRSPAIRRDGITIRTGRPTAGCSRCRSVPNITTARTGISRSSIRRAPCRCSA